MLSCRDLSAPHYATTSFVAARQARALSGAPKHVSDGLIVQKMILRDPPCSMRVVGPLWPPRGQMMSMLARGKRARLLTSPAGPRA